MKMLKYLFFFLSFYSCVSSKIYEETAKEKDTLKKERDNLSKEIQKITTENKQQKNDLAKNKKKIETLSAEKTKLEQDNIAMKNNTNSLKESLRLLEQNRSDAIINITRKNRDLLSMIEEKQLALTKDESRLGVLNRQLTKREEKIKELESLLKEKDEKLEVLKTDISRALLDYKNEGISIDEKEGRLYISMENKLLFKSGSWQIEQQGKLAIKELSKVLSKNSDISILIEGHTDNSPYIGGNNGVNDNWDLSAKRALAVVKILEKNNAILSKNITAAGRGEYDPVASNESPQGKSKNRRIEVILTPNISKIMNLIDHNQE